MSPEQHSAAEQKATELAQHFAALPQVVAVALGGSYSSAAADDGSDIDLYVYTSATITPDEQAALIERSGGATWAELDLPYWGGVNMWRDAASGITVDCMYFGAAWIEEQVARVMDAHEPSMGYSTCFCRTVAQSRVLHDPRGWYGALQARCTAPYPDELRRKVITHNHPLLRTIMSSYQYQIERAVERGDLVSVNHRLAALLASYFDILFALNRVLHPGEKRLLAFARRECALLPACLEEDVNTLLAASGTAPGDVVAHLARLLDRLDALLAKAGFDLRSDRRNAER
jgi:hypothetical protein